MDIHSTIELNTGSRMPLVGLGTWRLTNNTAQIIERALELGYRMIDTSGDYGTQPGVGEGIRESGIDRDEVYVVTKIEETDDAYAAAKNNLKELQLDYVNLLLIHRPPPTGAGEELWNGLMRAKKEGLATDIGVSNYTIDQMEVLINASGEVPVVNQIEWSPFGYSEEMYEYCKERNIVIMAYSPLTRGRKLGDDVLETIATTYSKSPAQIIIRWNMQRGTVPLPKAGQEKHLEENINVFDFSIEEDDMKKLNSLNKHYSSFDKLLYM